MKNTPVCPLDTSLCVRSKRLRVYRRSAGLGRLSEGTRLAVVFVVRAESSRSSNGPDQDAMPAVSRNIGPSEERLRAQDVPLGATVHAIGSSEGNFCTTFLVKFVQLSQTIRGSSLQQPVIRGQSAHEQT